jgi:PAS domain S-box-containing protein
MKQDRPSRFWRSVAQCVLGGIGLSVVTFLGFRLGLGFAAAAFADLILIVLLSLIGNFTASIILSFAAVLSLDYFFTQPLLSFYVEALNDILGLAGFLTSSIMITGLAVKLRKMASHARASQKELVETVPALVWSALADGSRDFHSQRWLEFTGLSSAEAAGDGWTTVFHPEDRAAVVEKWRSAVTRGELFEVEARERSAKGEYRSMLVRAAPLRDARGNIVKWYGSSTDIEDLRQSQMYLAEAQRIARTGSFGWRPDTGELIWSEETYRIVDCDPSIKPNLDLVLDRTHPEDRALVRLSWERASRAGEDLDYERRLLLPDGSVKRVHTIAHAAKDASGKVEYIGAVMDVTAVRQIEAALRESEGRFRALIQFSSDVYWESDAQHRFTRQEFAEGLGDAPVPGSDIGIGKTRWELPYLEPDEEAWRKHRQTLDAHLPFRDFELARPRPDGGKRYWSVSGLPVFDERGRFIGYRGLGRQITEHKRIEEEIRQREKELREVLETIPAMTVTVLPDGTNVFIGKRFAEYSGLSPEDAQGSGWKACVHPDDLDPHVRKWRASLASGEPIEIETRFRRADGEYRWFLARAVPLRDEKGNILKWYEVLTDIEDRKRAEAALRESEEQWKAVFENNPVMCFMVDATGIIISVNPFGAEQLGYGVDELIGRPVQILFPEADRESALKNKFFCLEHLGRTMSWELRKLRKDGEALWVRETARAMMIQNRPVVLVVSENITEGKRAGEALRVVQTELAHANRIATMGQLTASIAHEVNQPLTGLVSSGNACLRWLAVEPPNLEAARRAVERIVNDGIRAGEVITRIRALAAKSPPRQDWVNINDAIQEAIALISGEVQRNRVSLKTELSSNLPLIVADRIQLQQVIINLMMNAVEAMSGVSPAQRELSVVSANEDSEGVVGAERIGIPARADEIERPAADHIHQRSR